MSDGKAATQPTDQYLSPGQLGYKDERIYPLEPDRRRARALAEGHRRGGKAVLYTSTDVTLSRPGAGSPAQPEGDRDRGRDRAVSDGCAVRQAGCRGRVLRHRLGWLDPWPDPGVTLDHFDGRTIGQLPNTNLSYFNSPKYNRLIEAASRLPAGPERYRTYGELDVDIAKNAAPAIPFLNPNGFTFVGPHTGCVAFDIFLDLAAVCLK